MKRQSTQIQFATQLGLALKQSIPLTLALERLTENMPKQQRKTVLHLLSQVKKGFFLSQAAHYHLHPSLITFIRMGEATQTLAHCLCQGSQLLTQLEQQKKQRQQALAAPIISLSLSLMMAITLILTMTPPMRDFYESLNISSQHLETLTQLEYFFQKSIPYTLLCLAVLVCLGRILWQDNTPLRKRLLTTLRRTPYLGPACCFHCYTLWLISLKHCIQESVSLAEAIPLCSKFFERSIIASDLEQLNHLLHQGFHLNACCTTLKTMPKAIKTALSTYSHDSQLHHLSFAVNQLQHLQQERNRRISLAIPPCLHAANATLIIWLAQTVYQPMVHLGDLIVQHPS